MAKVHDKYVIELAEVIKGYGNNPDVADPFRLSEFYRFYELPNIAVSQENFEKMKLLDDVPFGYSQEYINQIKWERDLAIQQLNELGYGLGEEIRTDDDTISRRAAIRWVKTECNPYGKPTLDYESGKKVIEHLKAMPSAQQETMYYPQVDGVTPSVIAQPEQRTLTEDDYAYCTECDHVEMCRWYPMYGCEFKSRQSAQPEEVIPHRNFKYQSYYWCECGNYLGKKGNVKYCSDCGRKVNWDG